MEGEGGACAGQGRKKRNRDKKRKKLNRAGSRIYLARYLK